MRSTRLLIISIIWSLSLTALPLPAQHKQPPAKSKQAPAKHKEIPAADQVAKLRSDWAANLHAKKLDQITALYAEDAVFLQPNGQRVTGRPAIRDLCKNVMETFTSDISLHSIASEISGDLAYDSGDFHETMVKLSDDTKADTQGNYLMIFKRQRDGSWLILEQVWTMITPATE
jgi:uncharacterized protein (TIGR02246 family)